MDSPESPTGGLLHSLNAVVGWLHSEGFYAAEETLLREIENRYPAPDAVSPRSLPQVTASPGSSIEACSSAVRPLPPVAAHAPRKQQQQQQQSPSAAAASEQADQAEDTLDFQPALQLAAAHSLTPVDSMESAEKVLEAWCSKSTTPTASPKKAMGLSPPTSPASKAFYLLRGGCDLDEYDNDDDPGYLRLDVVGQEAALGLDLDQLSESSRGEQLYHQLQQYDASGELAGEYGAAAAHARHSSIDMGQLNRQLRGAGSSASSLQQRARSKQQRGGAQAAAPQQPLLLYEPVNSGEHWRSSSGQPLLPPGAMPSLLAIEGSGGSAVQQAPPGVLAEAEPEDQQQQQRAGSPTGSSQGAGPDHKRSDSFMQRQEGTAQWVFDRANSADQDAYRSLLSHLDRPSASSTPTSQQGLAAEVPPPSPPAAASGKPPRPPPSEEQQASMSLRQLQQRQPAAEEAEVTSRLVHQESISRVSSLGESMLQEAAAAAHEEQELAAAAAAAEEVEQQVQQQGQPAAAEAEAAQQPQEQGVQQQLQQQQQQQQREQQQQEQQHQQHQQEPLLPLYEAEPAPEEPVEFTPQRPGHHLSALRVPASHLAQPGSVALGRRLSMSTAADTTAAERGSSPGSGAHTPDGASIIDYSDPFSFPVTPPSEVAVPPDPAPLFGSWASLKSSPDRKGGLGGYGTEDESTPARRRYQQQAAAAAVAAAAAAKEQVGVQRSIKFPPLGAPGAASGPGGLRGYGSSSHLLSYATPSQALTDDELSPSEFDQEFFDSKYEVISLKVVHRRHSTGFEQARELPLHIGDLIAGRYQIVDLLGQAAFSRAVQALDLKTGALVCLKIIKNNKDYFDQGLDEVKLLRYVNAADPGDDSGLLRLHDFFYFKEHLVLVTELLRANLYEFQKYNRESGDEPYFTLPRIQSIARQVLTSLAFLHSLGLVHADLKPENILVKSYSQCRVKVIDLGSSCFLTDHLSSYVQSRSYRAPEVILGLQYDQKIDLWSLGCILAELATGRVLFQNDSVATLLARMEGILGPVPGWMLHRGRYSPKYYLRDGRLFEKNSHTGRFEFLRPKATCLARRVPQADDGLLAFLKCLLQVDPTKRPSAAEALQHPWLQHGYYKPLQQFG